MRFVTMFGFTMVASRLTPFPEEVSGIIVILIVAAVLDLADFIMNIIKTFKNK